MSGNFDAGAARAQRSEDELEWLSDVKSEITKRLGNKIALSALAATARMNDLQLLMRFQQETGIALARYIHLSRLKAVISLLHETTLPLAAIAVAAGFDNLKHMNAACEKDFGSTSDELRRSHRRKRSTASKDKDSVDMAPGFFGLRNSVEPKIFRACGAI